MKRSRSESSSWWGQVRHNKIVALVLAMIVMVPFAAVPADRHLGGAAAFTLEGFALLLAVALLWRARWNFKRDEVVTFLKTGPNAAILLLMGLIVLSCAFAPNKMFGIQETLRWGAGILLFFVVAYQFRQSKHLYLLVDTLLFVGTVTALLSLGQYVLDPTMRGATLFGNQQLLGSFLMILLPVAAVIALTGSTSSQEVSIRQLAAQFATVIMGGCLLLAHTRSAWIGAAVGLVMLAVLVAATSPRLANWKTQKHKLVLPGILAVVTLGFVLLMGVQNNAIVARADSLSNVSTSESWQIREQQWKGTLAMIDEHPLTGWGIGQYPLDQYKFTDVGLALSPNGVGVRTSLAEQAHNFYLQTTAELGLGGLLLVVALLATFMTAGIRRVIQMDAGIRRSLLIASLAGIAAFAVDAISSPSWQTGQVSIFFWLILGMGVACLRPKSKLDRFESESETYSLMPRLLRPISIVASVLILSLMVLPTSRSASADSYSSWQEDVAKVAVGVVLIGGVYYIVDAYGNRTMDSNQSGSDMKSTTTSTSTP